MLPNAKQGMCLLCCPQNMEKCLESVSGNENLSPLERNIKQQKEQTKQTVNTYCAKMSDVFTLYNISHLLKNFD